MAGTLPRIHRHECQTTLLSPWKSLPNLFFNNNWEKTTKEKRSLFKDSRNDTLVPFSPIERSKSMDHFTHVPSTLNLVQESDLDLSNFDLYVSKDFTDIMNISISERSDMDSTDANQQELDESLDAWTELQTSQLTRSNLTESLAMRMYSYENLDRVGKNLYKINKWFQKCSFDENDDPTTKVKTTS